MSLEDRFFLTVTALGLPCQSFMYFLTRDIRDMYRMINV